jgi:serine/threonine protein kinase
VKILDFGLARLLQNQSITTYGLALGTPSFMSPEQAAGRLDDIDGRTDLFALAATGFRLRAGRRIHEAESPVELVMKMAKVPAPRLGTVAPGVSEPFARVIDRGLEFKREDRYETAAAMSKDVRLAIKQLEAGVGATRVARPPGPPPPIPRAAKKRNEPSAAAIELSDSDIVAPQRRQWPQVDESIRIPKNRSVLPWLLLLVVVGIGGRLWGEKALGFARARWTAAAPTGATAAQDPPPGPPDRADRTDAATATQGDAATGPQVARADRKPGAVTPSPSPAPGVTRHHAPARTSPAQILKTKKHRP